MRTSAGPGRWSALLLLCAPSAAAAQAPSPPPARAVAVALPPLTLDEVLRSSARAAPQIVAALADVRQAQGRALTAEGAFDTVFDIDARDRALGFYDGAVAAARVTRPLAANGGSVYGRYRVSRGTFPVYEDENYTNKLGELRVGALFALLRDRFIDARRGGRALAAGDVAVAGFEAAGVAIGIQGRAIRAYQDWLGAGLRLRAYRALLDLADERRGAIVRQIELGARPEILLTENDQNLVRRRALVVQSEQALDLAANALSLFYRDADGEPIAVGPERLPDGPGGLVVRRGDAVFRPADRPDLRTLLAQVDQAATRLALAQNDLRPRLDLSGDVAKDVGPEGIGGRSRTPLEAIVGVRFSMPLENRAARGRVVEAGAQIDALTIRGRLLQDQITTEVRGLDIAIDGGTRLVDAAGQERALARRLAEAERRRFALGSSDFFLVNQREETATDAEIRLIDAQLQVATAQANLVVATADRQALGLPR